MFERRLLVDRVDTSVDTIKLLNQAKMFMS